MSNILLPEPPKTFSGLVSDDAPTDVNMEDLDMGEDEASPQKHFIVAVDFGTTFSSVAFLAYEGCEPKRRIDPEQIECVEQYPDEPPDSYEQRREVPTESWYLKALHRNDFIPYGPSDEDSSSADDDASGNGLSPSPDPDSPPPTVVDLDVMDVRPDGVDSEQYLWGYGVQKQLLYPDQDCDKSRRIWRSKLILDTRSQHTIRIRDELEETFRELKKNKLITQSTDVIADFLQRLFKHTKEQLERSYHFRNTDPVEFVLCVPIIWTARACRIMQAAMAMAIHHSGFSRLASGSIDNLFIISEPEAAAACLLAGRNDIKPSDTFVLIDAGGGTVDAITYTVDKQYPLRLKAEAVEPGGALCGSSYLNEAFADIIAHRLKDEHYLEKNGRTIAKIVDSKVVEFENRVKRRIDVTDPRQKGEWIYIQDLRPSQEKRFLQSRLLLNRDELEKIYMPCFNGVANLMMDQLISTKRTGLHVKKVLLIGGFAASRPLRKHLDKVLSSATEFQARKLELLTPKVPITAVSRGAVLRALWKEDGPARKIQSSYGFLKDEPWEPNIWDAHKEVQGRYDKIDGERYVKNTIDWLIKKGDEVPPLKEYLIPVSHTFAANRRRFLCEEVLYISDESHESHYRKTHEKNRGAEVAGTIVADMTFVKTDGLLELIVPEKGERGTKHWKVDFDLVMIVDGRNLRYEARYPRGEGGRVQEKGQTSIAAAFHPGTK